jgi:hypothetical protein
MGLIINNFLKHEPKVCKRAAILTFLWRRWKTLQCSTVDLVTSVYAGPAERLSWKCKSGPSANEHFHRTPPPLFRKPDLSVLFFSSSRGLRDARLRTALESGSAAVPMESLERAAPAVACPVDRWVAPALAAVSAASGSAARPAPRRVADRAVSAAVNP